MRRYRNFNRKGLLTGLILGLIGLIATAGATACSKEGSPTLEIEIGSYTPNPVEGTVTQTPEQNEILITLVPDASPSPEPTVYPSAVPTPTPTLVPTVFPSPTPTQVPPETPIEEKVGIATDDSIVVRTSPTSESQEIGTLKLGEKVKILGEVEGQMWLNGNQSISAFGAFPDWVNKWYKVELENGKNGFVYSAFIFIPKPGEASPFVSGKKWVEVDRANQILHAYVDGQNVFQAPVGIGKPWWPTPLGDNFKVWTRILNETMSGADYHIENVLFTQYFTSLGHGIHLDWWHDDSYFGNEPTSHGCVGLQLHDAQWLWFFGFEGMPVKVYE